VENGLKRNIQKEFKFQLVFYYSKHCRAIVADTVTPGVLPPSPLKEILSRDYE
jgi:hypothetical protein